MVGGYIIGITINGDEALVNVQGTGCEAKDTMAVRCKHEGKPLAIGDGFWWQMDTCYWTPKYPYREVESRKSGIDYDIRLPKIGYSHTHSHLGE